MKNRRDVCFIIAAVRCNTERGRTMLQRLDTTTTIIAPCALVATITGYAPIVKNKDESPKAQANREAVAAHARRERLGLWLIKDVEVGWQVIETLIEHGYLDRAKADDDRTVGKAISKWLVFSSGRPWEE